jgi:arylsulfatase A-like enzyme
MPRLTARLRHWKDEAPAFLAGVQGRSGWYARTAFLWGLALGLTESAWLAAGGGEFWPHDLWLSPVTYGVAFSAIGVSLSFPWPGTQGPDGRTRVLVFGLTTLSVAAWMLHGLGRVHPLATLTFALGLASLVTRVAMPYVGLLAVTTRRAGLPLVGTVLALTVWSFAEPELELRRALARQPDPQNGARSVLLLVLDTVRGKSLSLLGYDRPTTPSLERWASRGVVFERAMSTSSWTLPSHSGMFTGRWAHELSADWTTSLDDEFPTIAEAMRDRGYMTGGFVGNLAYTNRGTGLARGFLHYEDFKLGFWQAVSSTGLGRQIVTDTWLRNVLGKHEVENRKRAEVVNDDFLEWLDRIGDQPYFAFLNYFDAHEPYMPPAPYREQFAPGIAEPRGPYNHAPNQADRSDWWEMSPEEVAAEQSLYDASIAYLDSEIDRLLTELDARGLLENTIVVITADHGEHFGEHGLFMHGNNLYLPQVNVPLVVIGPGIPGGQRVTRTASLRDLPATILALAGLEAPGLFPGRSLERIWTDTTSTLELDTLFFSLTGGFGPDATPLALGDMWSVMTEPHQYILLADGEEELYDFVADPGQLTNIVDSRKAEPALEQARSLRPTEGAAP